MNPDTQVILDEIARRFTDHEAKWDRRLSGQDSRWAATFTDFAKDQKTCVQALENASGVFEEWRLSMEGVVDDLRLEVGKVSKHWERDVVDKSTAMMGVLAPTPPAAERPSAGATANSPHGHRFEMCNREDGFGSVTTLLHPPFKGTCLQIPPSPSLLGGDHRLPEFPVSAPQFVSHASGTSSSRLPKFNFPVFDGEHPKLWIRRSYDYFDMYSVETHLWVKVASMHFTGSAARWLSSLDDNFQSWSWSSFSRMVLERFGKDEYELFIRKLFHIKQTTSVSEYVDQFNVLVDNLVSYGRHTDPMYFIQRFVDGLREDIRVVVIVQRPTSSDTACVLALLQEEVAVPVKRWDARRLESSWPVKGPAKGPFPLPLPPRGEKQSIPEGDGRKAEQFCPRVMEDKLAALRAYRRARGLCYRCAEKWSKDHQCSATV
jgi:hypothetical protein